MTNGQTPWMEAIECQHDSIQALEAVIREGYAGIYPQQVRFLKMSETYAWVNPALEAVQRAAQSMPTDVALDEKMLPHGNGHGFWYFTPPLNLMLNGENVTALQWSVSHLALAGDNLLLSSTQNDIPNGVAISAWHTRRMDDGRLVGLPILGGAWNFGESLDTLLVSRNVVAGTASATDVNIKDLCTFFQAACFWLQSEIVEARPQFVERHRRKEFAKRGMPATVKLVALRHKHYDGAPEFRNDSTREYDYQWVVGGHWRHQPYGPGRTGRKLLYINPYIKGPEGKPLKPEVSKVYVVMK